MFKRHQLYIIITQLIFFSIVLAKDSVKPSQTNRDGNCAEVLWSFMGISIPGWLLIGFLITLLFVTKSFLSANEIHSHK